MDEENIKENSKVGFKAAGIVLLDRQVLKRLPDGQRKETPDLDSDNTWTNTFKSFLQKAEKQKKRKLNVPARRGIEGRRVNDASKSDPRTSKGRRNDLNEDERNTSKSRRKITQSRVTMTGEISLKDLDAEMNSSDFNGVDCDPKSDGKEEALLKNTPVHSTKIYVCYC